MTRKELDSWEIRVIADELEQTLALLDDIPTRDDEITDEGYDKLVEAKKKIMELQDNILEAAK